MLCLIVEGKSVTQIRAKPKHLFSWAFDLYLDERPLTGFDLAWLREAGQFRWSGTDYLLSREGFWSGDFLLAAGGEIQARATKRSVFGRKFIIRTEDRELLLAPVSVFSRSFRLVENGSVIGGIVPDRFPSRACTLDLPRNLAIPVQVFVFWLVVLLWRRASSSAGSG